MANTYSSEQQNYLNELDLRRERELYVKIYALDLDENPLESIVGRVTQGSVPVDGKSAVRRTCSFTLLAQELNINDYLWGLNTKVQVFIGMKDKPAEEIVWFKMGTFVLTTFNITVVNAGYQIALQGKDKMCMLNGDVGGAMTALTYNFDSMEIINKFGNIYKEKIKLETLIREAIHTFGMEPYHNIIVNDLDDVGLELLQYRGEVPLYLIYDIDRDEIANMTINDTQKYTRARDNAKLSIADLIVDEGFKFKTLNSLRPSERINGSSVNDATLLYDDNKNKCNLIKVEQGETCGYRICDLVYAGELAIQAGASLTSMLDKIVKMLGDYEYFYNLDGQFVFQRKRTYLKTSWNNLKDNGDEQWAEPSAYSHPVDYSFENNVLITQFQNNPALNNVKNDFVIWGQKTGVNGGTIPVHMRYAIDRKPTYYTLADGSATYTTKTKAEVEEDKKNGTLVNQEGYQKEPSRFGLSEDWWEVRDWAKAWEYSGLPVPTSNLGTYCPIKALLYRPGIDKEPAGSSTGEPYALTENLYSVITGSYNTTDDIIFHADGSYWGRHGDCAHSYTWWLDQFQPGGAYAGGYAYFYKPQVPNDVTDAMGNKVELKLGATIYYNMDWRELIYQMALDHNKYGNMNNSNTDTWLYGVTTPEGEFKVISKTGVVDGHNCASLLAGVEGYVIRQVDLTTAIRTQNSTFYPSGYTGYEQYYIDLEGFWRQLYDPTYTQTYSPVYLNQEDFNTIVKFGDYYYDAPVYKQCTADDTYFPNIDYYVNNSSVYTKISITRGQFMANPINYWYISSTKIEKIPISTSTYYRGTQYYIKENNKYAPVTTSNSADMVKYYIQKVTDAYKPLYEVENFVYTRSYYKKTEDGKWVIAEDLARDEYTTNPFKYYKKTGNTYEQCIKFAPWTAIGTSSNIYRITNTGARSKLSVAEQSAWTSTTYKDMVQTDANKNTKFVYLIQTTSYEPCVKPSIDYNPDAMYYEVSEEKEYDLDNKGEYITLDGAPVNPRLFWKKDVFDAPETLIFWFDFLDDSGDIANYAVYNIGDRPKAVNDNDVKGIYFRETPSVIYCKPAEWNDLAYSKSGYSYCQLPESMENLFTVSGQGKSAKDVLDSWLYEYSYCTENITIQAIPVYHLEPNTLIYVHDEKSHINGQYIITKINYPLDIKGTMTINATKVIDRIY